MKSRLLTILLLFLGALILPGISFGEEVNQDGWPIPDLRNLVPYSIAIQRADGAEKIVEKYYTSDGGHVARLIGNGKIYAYAVDRDREPPIDYLLLDTEGFGKFTVRLKSNETYRLPEWIFR